MGNFPRSPGPYPRAIDWRKKGKFVSPVKNQVIRSVGQNPYSRSSQQGTLGSQQGSEKGVSFPLAFGSLAKNLGGGFFSCLSSPSAPPSPPGPLWQLLDLFHHWLLGVCHCHKNREATELGEDVFLRSIALKDFGEI